MKSLSIKRLGLAFGVTGAILYIGCILVMATVGRDGTIDFFNSLFHGLDTSSIIQMHIPWWEALMGIAEAFIVSWLIGSCIAAVYNLSIGKTEHK
jgi:hypothetical protein